MGVAIHFIQGNTSKSFACRLLSRSQQLVDGVSLGDLAVDGMDRHTSGAVLQQVSDPSRSQR